MMIVTAIVPTYNEGRYIGRCLKSLFAQRGIDDFEVLVVDGGSEDDTVNEVRSFTGFGTRLRLLHNPHRLGVYACNLGCRAARGKYVAFISAHSTYDPAHLRTCVDLLERHEAEAVGPLQVATGDGILGAAVVWAMSSPFGIGNARYRFTQRQEHVDSVFSMVLARRTFEALGGYDERIPYDEDSEFCYRLRMSGGRVVVTPASTSRYQVRRSLTALARQMRGYGYWRRFTQRLHASGVPLRVYAPPALVVALGLSLLAWALGFPVAAAAAPGAYAAYLAAAMLAAARQRVPVASICCLAAVLPCMHLSYGVGYWQARITPSGRVLATNERRHTARRNVAR